MNAHAVLPVPRYATQAERLVTLTALNHAMLTAAEAQEWDKLAEMEGQRADLLAELFANSFYALDDAALIPVLTQTFSINQRMTTLLEQAKLSCQTELAEISTGRRAQLAYTENTGEV